MPHSAVNGHPPQWRTSVAMRSTPNDAHELVNVEMVI
jgi:hypothetical protein